MTEVQDIPEMTEVQDIPEMTEVQDIPEMTEVQDIPEMTGVQNDFLLNVVIVVMIVIFLSNQNLIDQYTAVSVLAK